VINGRRLEWQRQMEEDDNIIVKWAQEDVGTSYSLLNKINVTLHEARCTFLILEWKNVPDKNCRANRNAHFMLNNFFFFRKSCCSWHTWENTVERDRPQMAIWRMRIACWIPKAINMHSQYVILNAFPQQQWLYKGASMLRYTFAVCLATM